MEQCAIIILIKEKLVKMLTYTNKKNAISLFRADLYNHKIRMLEKTIIESDNGLEKKKTIEIFLLYMKRLFPEYSGLRSDYEDIVKKQSIAYHELCSVFENMELIQLNMFYQLIELIDTSK
jgi:hypothetical protein